MTPDSRLVVVVPYYNERESVTYLLDRLWRQTQPPNRVVLVNSSSTDDSAQVIDAWISQHNCNGRYLNLNAGTSTPGGSKTAGIRATSEELVAFMDCGLTFPEDWLQQQLSLLDSSQADWVSGVNRTTGTGVIDSAAIAHTVGFGRARPAIPSSIIKRASFKTVGTFRNLRAGYDVEWVDLARKAGLKRMVNWNVIVEYHSINYADGIAAIFAKSRTYARPSVFRRGNLAPAVYILTSLIVAVAGWFNPELLVPAIGGYLVLRTAVATRKSRRMILHFLRSPRRFVVLLLVGIVLDFGKLVGFVEGVFQRFFWRRTISD